MWDANLEFQIWGTQKFLCDILRNSSIFNFQCDFMITVFSQYCPFVTTTQFSYYFVMSFFGFGVVNWTLKLNSLSSNHTPMLSSSSLSYMLATHRIIAHPVQIQSIKLNYSLLSCRIRNTHLTYILSLLRLLLQSFSSSACVFCGREHSIVTLIFLPQESWKKRQDQG